MHILWNLFPNFSSENYKQYTQDKTFVPALINQSLIIGWGVHLRCKFNLPDSAPSKGKLSITSPSNIIRVSVMMHFPNLF